MTAYQHPKLSVYNLPWPTDWGKVFGRSAPLIVEIGFGNGNYLLELARQNPDCNVIGLEIASRSLEKAERKLGLNGVHTPAPSSAKPRPLLLTCLSRAACASSTSTTLTRGSKNGTAGGAWFKPTQRRTSSAALRSGGGCT